MAASGFLCLLLASLLSSHTGAQNAPTFLSSSDGGPARRVLGSLGPAPAPYPDPSLAPGPTPKILPSTSGDQSDIIVQHLNRLGLTTLSALLAPLQPASYFASLGKPVTILSPTNAAFAQAQFTLDTVQLGLLNDTAYRQFVTNLLNFHVLVGQVLGVNDFNVSCASSVVRECTNTIVYLEADCYCI